MIQDFAAIDFETANHHPCSVCSVGVVVVRGGEVADTFYGLIQPEPNYYLYWNTRIHGLTAVDTDRMPVFPHVWQQIEGRIAGLPLVAHNSAFDEACLKAAFRTYGMDYPGYAFRCTCRAARKAFPGLADHRLHTVAAACGVRLDRHHHALADAEACAGIALKILRADGSLPFIRG
jgi:DNA polymerase-3 subunit epsilon